MMQKKVLIPVAAVVVIVVSAVVLMTTMGSSEPALASSTTLSVISGDEVYLTREGGVEEKITQTVLVVQGDSVRTGKDSIALITFEDGTTVELEPETEVTVEAMTSNYKKVMQSVGRTWSGMKRLVGAQSTFEMETPSAAAVVRGTWWDTDVDWDGNTIIGTYDGSIDVTAQGQTQTVGAGSQSRTNVGEPPQEPEPIPPPRNSLEITIMSPAWGLVVDSLQRSVGVVPPGVVVSQIPGGLSTGAKAEPQLITIPIRPPQEGGKAEQTFWVLLYGKETGGDVTVKVDGYSDGESMFTQTRSLTVEPYSKDSNGEVKYMAELSLSLDPEEGFITGGALGQLLLKPSQGPGTVQVKDWVVKQVDKSVPPRANFVTSLEVDRVHFINRSTGDITGYEWDFGDGETSSEIAPTHLYRQLGTFEVSLTVTGPGGSDTLSKKALYLVQVDFSGQPLQSNEPLSVQFTDATTPPGQAASWLWHFGDGQTSREQNPLHVYEQDGVYTVTLSVTKPDGDSDKKKRVDYVAVLDTGPEAHFQATPTSGNEALSVSFTDTSISHDGVTSWLWDFGDGQTSTQANPTHVYAQDGVYDVTLIVTESDGPETTDSITETGYITVFDTGPTADFSASPRSGNSRLTVSFSDRSTSHDGITSWLWDFGDGSTSSERNPSHLYVKDGRYDVTLTVTETDGPQTEDVETKAGYIEVKPPVPNLSTPANGAFSSNNKPAFTWENVSTITGTTITYSLQVDDDAGFSSPVTINRPGLTSPSFTPTTALADGTYYWRVSAVGSQGTNSGWSASWSVTVDTTPPTVTALGPNGGEFWAGGSTQTIAWESSDINMVAAPITIEYWDGDSWEIVPSDGANDGSHHWLVTPIDRSDARIRVTAVDLAGNSTTEQSGEFTIDSTAPSITVTSPNEGEFWGGGSVHSVTWTAGDANMGGSPIKLEYYNGSAWVQIDAGLDNTGWYQWTVPSLNVSTAKVRATATDRAGNTGSDVSDASFTIDSTAPSITVTSPNGGEFWGGGSVHSVTWTAGDANMGGSPIKLEYYNGSAWVQIATGLANMGTYQWTVPSLDTSTARVRATATDRAGNTNFDESNASFTIDSTLPTVTVTSPNGGEFWAGGGTQTITWTATDTNMADNPITLEYFDGTNWYQIAANEVNDGSYEWTLPTGVDTSNARVRMTAVDKAGNSRTDDSDAPFTIDSTPPVVTVTSPNGGEVWQGGSIHNITWTASDINMADNPITIEYYNGAGWVQIATNEVNDGSYELTLPNDVDTSDAKVRVTAADRAGNQGSDESDAAFTIDSTPPAVRLTTVPPDPTNDNTPDFQGTATDTMSAIVSVEYSLNGGAWTAATAVDGAFGFTLGPLADGDYTVRVKATDAAGNTTLEADYASDSFSVDIGAPAVTIEELKPDPSNDNTPTFTGTAEDAPSTWIKSVEYRIDEGPWQPAQAQDGTFNSVTEAYTFTTAALDDGQHTVHVRATDAAGNTTAAEDYANDSFTLDTEEPVISSVDESEITGSGATITWTTNELANSRVVYDRLPHSSAGDYPYGTPLDETMVTDHTVNLSGLDDGTPYYYRVISSDQAGNETVSDEFTFTTPDTTGPDISAVEGSSDTAYSATVSWETDERSTTQVAYSLTSHEGEQFADVDALLAAYGSSTAENTEPATYHAESLSDLQSSSIYHYRVISRDGSGNAAWSEEYSFETPPDETPPVIFGLSHMNMEPNTLITWNTDELATTQVVYSTDSHDGEEFTNADDVRNTYGSWTIENPTMTAVHQELLMGLDAGVTYHIRVISVDRSGNVSWSEEYDFEYQGGG